MIRLANLSIRRPKAALTFWVVVAAIFTAIGLGVTNELSPTMTFTPGTESTKAEELAEEEFGSSTLVPVLLTGPQAQLDRQGPALVRKLAAREDTRVISAWDAGEAGEALRPSRTEAMLVASVAHTDEAMVETYQEEIDDTIDGVVTGDVTAHVSGTPTLGRAIQDESLETARKGLAFGLPLLFIALLLVLRAPVAAAVTAAFGGVTAFVSFGIMTIVGEFFSIDAIALALGALMGMVVGTALALLILTRFQKEEAAVAGQEREATIAASIAVATTGRAVLLGGTGLVISLLVASAVGPRENLESIGAGAVTSAVLAIGAAVVVMPAVLALFGQRLFVGSFGAPKFLAAPWRWLVGAESGVIRRAAVAGFLATALLVLMALPLVDLKIGPPDPRFLPEDSQARQDFDAIQDSMGEGYPTPFNIVVVSENRPITDAKLLRDVEKFQIEIAKDDRVASVAGPGTFRAETADLGTLEKQLDDSKELLADAPKDLGKLEGGLGQAGAGAAQLQGGLSDAADGALKLATGGADAQEGAGKLRAGLAAAQEGSVKISGGLNQALEGANALKAGSGQALAGARLLQGGLGEAAPSVEEGLPTVQRMADDTQATSNAVQGANAQAANLNDQLGAAASALQGMTDGKSDPQYDAALSALNTAQSTASGLSSSLDDAVGAAYGASVVATAFAGQVEELSGGLNQLHAGSTELTAGIARLQSGNAALAGGIDQLAGGGGELSSGLTRLRDGAGELQAGLGLLAGGAGTLGSGLESGVPKVGELGEGLGIMKSGVAKFRTNLPGTEDLERLQAQAPGLFDSGYFILAAIEGAQPADRNLASFAVNLEQGGTAGQIVVTPKQDASTEETQALAADLQTMTDEFAADTNTEAAVGGPAGEVIDFKNTIEDDIWPVVIATAVTVLIFLMIVLRSVLLPLGIVAMNLLGAAATFGIVTLLTRGDDPLLGGPGFVDPLQVIEMFASVFGIVLIFELLLLYRARDLYVQTGEPRTALHEALTETAAAATGAAAVMVAAVAPFTVSGLFNLRLTIGVAIAIVIHALITRPVLLPAYVAVLGHAGWWPTRRATPPPPPGGDGQTPDQKRRFTRARKRVAA
jgi:RND superfamily putative drug exporter